jgi:hypothetical protein
MSGSCTGTRITRMSTTVTVTDYADGDSLARA